MTTKSKKSIFDDYSLEEVPGVERYGLYNLFLTLSAAFGAIAVLFAGVFWEAAYRLQKLLQ